jgi:DNA-binding MarR family transcriptional regulator
MKDQTKKTGSSGCTCLRLRKASRRVSQIYDRSLEPLGLTVTQFSLLGYVAGFDGIGIGALAARLVMDPTTLTRNVRPLVRQGLVELVADADDQRSRCLHLTAAGRKAYRQAKPAWARAQREIDKALEDAGAPALNKVLDRVLERLAN